MICKSLLYFFGEGISNERRSTRKKTCETINHSGMVRGGPTIGSWHPGVVNFLMADGSVHAISFTIPVSVIESLAQIADGAIANLP